MEFKWLNGCLCTEKLASRRVNQEHILKYIPEYIRLGSFGVHKLHVDPLCVQKILFEVAVMVPLESPASTGLPTGHLFQYCKLC